MAVTLKELLDAANAAVPQASPNNWRTAVANVADRFLISSRPVSASRVPATWSPIDVHPSLACRPAVSPVTSYPYRFAH